MDNNVTNDAPADWLRDAAEPDSDDPRQWTPPQVLGLALRYAYGIEALQHQTLGDGWDESADAAEDVLFVRDLLAAWLALGDDEAFLDLAESLQAEVPDPADSDERLAELYRENKTVRAFIDAEYRNFRDDIAPARASRWWWLDAELYGHGIH